MSALDRDGLVHETIEHLIDQVAEAYKERDEARTKIEYMRDGISDMKAAMQSEIDAERLRGNTYRQRSLAMQLRLQSQRSTIKILQDMLKDTILERNALKKQVVRRDHWIDEALNSGNGTYRP